MDLYRCDSARSLPSYGTATSWPLLPDQGTPIGDELAAQYGVESGC